MVDLQKIVDRWSVDKGSDVMLPWLGSITCGEVATAIADALRQIAELRAERNGALAARDRVRRIFRRNVRLRMAAESRAEAAEAENARLRALPLKDEVERVLERTSKTVKRYRRAGLGDDVFHSDLCETDAAIDTLLSRLRAGGQDGWRSMPAPTLERIIAAGWQPQHGTTRGYWWYHEDATDDRGVPMDHPNATLWTRLTDILPAFPATPKQGEAK